MGRWDDDLKSNYISTKVGSVVTMKIKEINRVEGKPDYEPKTSEGKTQGFLFEFVSEDDKIMSVTTFAFQKALVNANIDVGDTIKVSHPKTGEYIVEKV